jgi:hypothetical protein
MEWLFDTNHIPPPPDPPTILPNKICKRCNISKPILSFLIIDLLVFIVVMRTKEI